MINLATKHNDPNKKLGFLEHFGYGMGDFACNMIYQPMAAFLLIYYTNVVGVNAATAAGIIGVSRIFDGVSDLIMGAIVDRTKSRYGKARCWLLRVCFPIAFFGILMFSVPSALGGMARIAWMFITYNMVTTVCYTAINLPYSSMICLMTNNAEERGILGTFRIVLAASGQLFINTGVLKLVGLLGNGDTYDQAGWTKAFIVIGILSILVYLFCFITTKERIVESEKEEPVNPIEALKSLLKNKYWILVTLASIFTYMFVGSYYGSVAYYVQYNLNNINYYSVVANALTVAEVIGLIILIPRIFKKYGKYVTYQMGIALMAIGSIGTIFVAHSLAGVCVMNMIKGIGVGAETAMIYGLVADTIDYGEWKTGIRCVGMGNAANSFSMKIGNGIGTALLGWVLSYGGFNAQNAVQSSAAKTAISVGYIYIPIIMLTLNFVVMCFYKLEKQYPRIAAELEERRAQK